ncbi:MAG: glycosyltransferase family 2 protein [Clostridia bacterium]|nr:glycosyltransferase family 2 protein [Clostridia bacterium]
MNKCLVTIIIPTYNRIQSLKKAIESIINQSYRNCELVIVDDNEKDSSIGKEIEGIVKEYQLLYNIKYVKCDKHTNAAIARNIGINQAKGTYITFLDDDDTYYMERIKTLVTKMEENRQYNIAYTKCIVKDKGKVIREAGYLPSDCIYELLNQRSFFGTGSNLFFKTEILNKINGFDEMFLKFQDLETVIRALEIDNKILFIPEILVEKNQDDRSNDLNIKQRIQYTEKFIEKFVTLIKKQNYDVNKIYANNYFEIVKMCIIRKDKSAYMNLKEKMKKGNIKMTIKMNAKCMLLYINNYIHIKSIYLQIKSKKYKRKN